MVAAIAVPVIVDQEAHLRFDSLFRERGQRSDHRFAGGYVDHVWKNGRPLFEANAQPLASKQVLEFGCNMEATAIVLSHLGAVVTAVDIDPRHLRIAAANAERYGVKTITFQKVSESGALPFADGSFDLITCISVLEYVRPDMLRARLEDLDRVLKPAGMLLVIGPSSRLALHEVHSGRRLVNYMPRWVDRLVGVDPPLQRGVAPWTTAHQFSTYSDAGRQDRGRGFIEAKRMVGMSKTRLAAIGALNIIARVFGASIGWLLPSISLALRKPAEASKYVSQVSASNDSKTIFALRPAHLSNAILDFPQSNVQFGASTVG